MPTTSITFNEVEIGVTVFAHLTEGVMPIMEAFSMLGSTRVIPLLAKLESLGIINNEEVDGPVTYAEVVYDAERRPNELNIVFLYRSEADVRMILGESLEAQSTWFEFVERVDSDSSSSSSIGSLMLEVSDVDVEDWSPPDTLSSHRSTISNESLDQSTAAWRRSRLPIPDIFVQQFNTEGLSMPAPDGIDSSDSCSEAGSDATETDAIRSASQAYSWPSSAERSLEALGSAPPRVRPIVSTIEELPNFMDLSDSICSVSSDGSHLSGGSDGSQDSLTWAGVSPTASDANLKPSGIVSEGFSDELVEVSDAEDEALAVESSIADVADREDSSRWSDSGGTMMISIDECNSIEI